MAGFYPQLHGVALKAFLRGVRDIRERAARELNLTDDNIVIRSLIPEDLNSPGQNAKTWTVSMSSTGATANSIVSGYSITDNRYILINGISLDSNAAADVTQVEITRKGSLARLWNLEWAAQQDDATVYFDDPITLDQNTTVTIDVYQTAAGTQGVIFLGSVAEKRGLLVNP